LTNNPSGFGEARRLLDMSHGIRASLRIRPVIVVCLLIAAVEGYSLQAFDGVAALFAFNTAGILGALAFGWGTVPTQLPPVHASVRCRTPRPVRSVSR
jgi:hypothetical protein